MSEHVLEVMGLRKNFGTAAALDDVSFDVAPGEIVGVIGPSGCGKSTLLRCINFLETPDDGFVRVAGDFLGRTRTAGGVVHRQSEIEITRQRHRVGFVFQQLNLWPHLDVLGNVAKAQITVLRRPRHVAERRARELLAQLGIADKANARPDALSGGQRQRVAIARALALDPAILLFDEPTSALDPEITGEVASLLRALARTGTAMLVVTHDIGFAGRVADRLLFFEAGRIVEEGSTRAVLDTPRDPRLARFLMAMSAGSTSASLPNKPKE